MTPTRDNIHLFLGLTFGIAIFLSALLFVLEKRLGRKIKWGGIIVFACFSPLAGIKERLIVTPVKWPPET